MSMPIEVSQHSAYRPTCRPAPRPVPEIHVFNSAAEADAFCRDSLEQFNRRLIALGLEPVAD